MPLAAPLVVGQPYLLAEMTPVMWQNAHTTFGCPTKIAAIYLGALVGTRTWHLFEVQVRSADAGVLLMNEGDLQRLTVTLL